MFSNSWKSHYVIRISVVAKFMFGKVNFVYNNPLHISPQQTPYFLFLLVVIYKSLFTPNVEHSKCK
jgi:hypothetical protein